MAFLIEERKPGYIHISKAEHMSKLLLVEI